jgi:iron complex outermembrane receptor protein
VTGLREQESELPSTYTGEVGPVSLFDANRLDDRETFQHEMRIATHWGGPFDMVGGVFYQEDTTTFCVVQVLGFLDLLGVSEGAFGDPTFFDNNPQILCNEQDSENYAVFADGTWQVNEKLAIGGGIRWTNEEKEWIGRNQVFVQALGGGFDPNFTWQDLGDPMNAADFGRFPTGVFEDDESWKELTWRGTVSYQFSDEAYGYFTYARGFKSGAYNDQTGTSGAAITARSAAPTDPEIADSFEAGVKLDLLERRLRLDLTAFHVTYDDAQRDLVAEFTNALGGTFQETRFFNAAEVTAQGIEAELTALLTERLKIKANLGYTDTEYDSFEADTDFDGTPDVDLSDRDVNRAPELQWGIDARYTVPLAYGTLDVGGNLSYEDDSIFVYSNTAPEFDSRSDERTLLSASVTWRDPSDVWFVRLYGKNLTDEEYRIGELPVANLWTFASFGAPRTWGVEAGYTFER